MARKPDAYDELDEACRVILVEEGMAAAAVRKSKRVILDAVGNGDPLPPWASRLIAADLQRSWLNTKAQDRAARLQARDHWYRAEIKRVAKQNNISEAAAKVIVVANFKELNSVENLNQYLRRRKRDREKEATKP